MKHSEVTFPMAALTALVLLASASGAAAETLNEMDPFTAQTYAQYLVEIMDDVEGQQVKVDANPESALGLAAGGEGVILVPVKGLKAGEEHSEVYTENGASLAYLFLSPRFNPVLDGKQVAQDKLHTVTYTDDSGSEKKATCLILTVRNTADTWHLYAYGKDAKPLIDAQFSESSEEADSPVAIGSTSAEDETSLVVTVFGKYAASFKIGQ